MRIDHPDLGQIPELRQLWKEAFGDSDAFLDAFFMVAFSQIDACVPAMRRRSLRSIGSPAGGRAKKSPICMPLR